MALRTALVSRCGKVELHAAPQRRGRFFSYCSKRFGVRVEEQKGSDLGERMQHAIATGLRRHRAVLLMGSDCPELRPCDLRRAARLLRGACDAVLAPAEDGGYALVGLRKARADVFSRIDWGKPSVYRETLSRLERSGLRWRALRTVWDVDRPEDLARLGRLLLRAKLARETTPVRGVEGT